MNKKQKLFAGFLVLFLIVFMSQYCKFCEGALIYYIPSESVPIKVINRVFFRRDTNAQRGYFHCLTLFAMIKLRLLLSGDDNNPSK